MHCTGLSASAELLVTRATGSIARCMLRQRGWLGVCPSHIGIVSKLAKPILKLFRPSSSPVILVFLTPRRCPIPRGTPLAGAINTWGWEKLAVFWRKSLFISETCEIGRWKINRKSWVPDWMVSFSMTLSDPNLGFKVTVYLQVKYLKKRCVLHTKLLQNSNRKPYSIYLTVPLSMTLSDLWPGFQGHDSFQSQIAQKQCVLISKLL